MSERSPSGAGPFRLTLEQQKKRAKELLAVVRAGDGDALVRWNRHRPDGAALCLATAQHVIARELGVPSWPRLKAHVEAMDRARRVMGRGGALDGESRTLHIRCGSDIRERLRDAGLAGDFLEYANPFCQGPVTDGPDFLDRRAAFLAVSYGPALGLSAADLRTRLEREEAGLAAANTYDRVVLWFEHDGYDQLILARCLERFAVLGPPPVLEMVSLNHFPGSTRFIGLGQLPPEALRLLWAKRRVVPWADCRVGQGVWQALTVPDPDGLAARLRQGFGGLPYMAAAVRRHLQELPGTGDGLGLTQRLILTALAERDRTVGDVWRVLMRKTDPLPFLTDLMLWECVGGLLDAADPAVTADTAPWPNRRLALTGTGRDVLAGRRDWLSCGPAERWVGGTAIRPGAPMWRWDDAADAIRCY
ncbi:hypothetical protein M2352_004118 [Azospirillum fermentarium]|uniref:DUF1835 domain-containing protein n=1 Tax=Azospirillum fermentarium TaxID=1233114 RepID=UPI002227D937|nr:DUF1835 domain-containing protein [Azospirillum fermentarium]MCW2248458.1 hypothetical protein [Azospirillum fermentarium]